MIDRFKSRPTLAALAAAAITALGVGGVAVAQSGSTPTDQATQAQNGTATEQAEGREKADGPEGSEKADDDGPGGA